MLNTQSTEYAKSSAKGFSYLVPVKVQVTLMRLLKRLPFADRDTYREYYRDIMAYKKCAPDSAQAWLNFIDYNFPTITFGRSRFARLMNEEIAKHEHGEYDPTLFPILDNGAQEGSEGEEAVPETKKRKATKLIWRSSLNNERRKATKGGKFTLDTGMPSVLEELAIAEALGAAEVASEEEKALPETKKCRATKSPSRSSSKNKHRRGLNDDGKSLSNGRPSVPEEPAVAEDSKPVEKSKTIDEPTAMEESINVETPIIVETPTTVAESAAVRERTVVDEPTDIQEPEDVQGPAHVQETAVAEEGS
jgi:hypothetical protein